MKPTNSESGGVHIGVMVAAVIVALIVGLGIGHAIHKTKTVSTGITSSAEALDNSLVTLGVDHMTLTDQAVDAALDGNADASATAAALYANGNAIGAAVGSVYGSSAQSTFDAVWKIHLDQFVDYAVAQAGCFKSTNALCTGSTNAAQTALNTIQSQYTVPLAQYLAKANPYLPESTLQTALTQHVAMTATMINDHVEGNYTAEASELNQGNTMIASIFSTLAGGIAKQFPAKFAN
jgi:hypothetical protein